MSKPIHQDIVIAKLARDARHLATSLEYKLDHMRSPLEKNAEALVQALLDFNLAVESDQASIDKCIDAIDGVKANDWEAQS